MNNGLNNLSRTGKILVIITIPFALAVIVLSILGIADVLPLELTIRIAMPLLSAVSLINGLAHVKNNRLSAILSIIAGAFILIVWIFVLCFK